MTKLIDLIRFTFENQMLIKALAILSYNKWTQLWSLSYAN